ncbi:MAG: SulP family inorganic anion transporter [Myxococcota bacterium]
MSEANEVDLPPGPGPKGGTTTTTSKGGNGKLVPDLGRDFQASIVVFLVALPLCIGVALASGVPPALGLITGIVGGILIGAFAGSPLQVSGPAAGLLVIIFQFVQDERFGLPMLGVVVLAAGAIQFAAGLAGLGRWFRAVSPSVIQGMLSGIGVLIFASQFHVMVDDIPPKKGWEALMTIPSAIYKGVSPSVGDRAHHIAAAIGLVTIVSLVAWNQLKPKKLRFVPGPLVAVVLATAVAAIFSAPILYIEIPDSIIASLNIPSPESFARITEPATIGVIITLAVVASAETLLCATAVDRLHEGPRTNYDKELWAQGLGNMVCGALGALPATGVIVRSSANVEAGATTRRSGIIHGFWLLLTILLVPHLLEIIPKACLAAILVYTGYRLFNWKALRSLGQKAGRSELAIALITITTIVATDLLSGVLLGFGLSIAKLLYTFTHLEVEVETSPGRVDITLHGAATFVRLPELAEALERLEPGQEVHLHVGGVAYIDHGIMELLQAFETSYEDRGGNVQIRWDDVDLRGGRRIHTQGPGPSPSGNPRQNLTSTAQTSVRAAAGAPEGLPAEP